MPHTLTTGYPNPMVNQRSVLSHYNIVFRAHRCQGTRPLMSLRLTTNTK